MTSLAGRLVSHYRVLDEIGRGGMGIVYRAQDTKLNREVALKVLPPELVADPVRRRRFIQEAQAAAALADPRIVVVHEIDEADGVTFIAMELIGGRKLTHVLDGGSLPVSRALDIAIELAEGLDTAHQKGIIHRDLKPANVVLTEAGHVKIIDFGLAKLMEPVQPLDSDAKTATHLHTTPGTVVGTVAYMSPEQVRGLSADHRSDIFSLGIVLQEMLTGRSPFHHPSAFDTLQAIVNAPAPRLSVEAPERSLGPRLQGLLDKCLAKRPEERYRDVEQLLVDLRAARAAVESSDARTVSSHVFPRLFRGGGRRTAAAAVLAVAVAGAFLATMAGYRRWRASPPSGIHSLVALPSRVHSGEADKFLADAIPDTLSAHLSQIRDLEVKLPPSSTDLERIGSDLGKLVDAYKVSAFVLSSVAVEAEHFTLTVQLVDGASRRLVWSRQYEGSRAGYPQMLREAAEGLGRAVQPASTVGAKALGEADLLVQRGRYHMSRYGALYRPEDAKRALEAFEQALALDPDRADAAANAAVLFARKAQIGEAGARQDIETWARRALRLDPRSSQAWNVLSYAEQQWGSRGSGVALEYALRGASFGPRDPVAQLQLGQVLMDDSCVLALEAYSGAARLDPLYLNARVSAAGVLELLGRADEARGLVEQILRLEPEAPLALLGKARLMGAQRPEQDALLASLEGGGRIHPAWLALVRDMVAVERGGKDAGVALERILKVARSETRFPAWDKFALLGVALLAQDGKDDEAIEILANLGESGVTPPYDMLARHPRLAPLRKDPRLRALVDASRVRFEAMLALLEAGRGRGELPAYLEKPLEKLRADTDLGREPNARPARAALAPNDARGQRRIQAGS